jgi:site-specific DNA-methyltransferase (adenine-specific)
MECGLRLHDTMHYCKESVTFPDANRYHPAHEYMFVFSKGAPRHFNGIRDWPNKWAGTKMHGTYRQPDGRTTRTNGCGKLIPALGLRRNWWVIANPWTGETDGHPAPMPYSMADDHIATWSAPGDTILDPFLGSGTSALAAIKLKRSFVGIEIEPRYFEIAVRRLREFHGQVGMFAPPTVEPARSADLFAATP